MDQPRFIVVAGPPCSGKSTVARELSDALVVPCLEMDQFRRRGLPISDHREEHRDIAYRMMHFTAELMAPWCASVILEATYARATCRQELAEVIERVNGALYLIECHVSEAIAVQRFAGRRSHPALDLTADRVAALAAAYPYSTEACAVGGDSQALQLSRVLRYVCTQPLSRPERDRWCDPRTTPRTTEQHR